MTSQVILVCSMSRLEGVSVGCCRDVMGNTQVKDGSNCMPSLVGESNQKDTNRVSFCRVSRSPNCKTLV